MKSKFHAIAQLSQLSSMTNRDKIRVQCPPVALYQKNQHSKSNFLG